MEREILFEKEVRIFTVRDIWDLFQRKKKKIIQVGLGIALLAFSALLLRPPHYKIEATFKEGGEKEGGLGGGLGALLGGLSTALPESQMSIVMKSHPVLKPLISKLGLQATVNQWGRWVSWYRSIRDNLQASKHKQLEDLDPFVFCNVFYEENVPLSFSLQFRDSTHFVLSSDRKKVEGTVGKEVVFGEVRFTLTQVPKLLRYRHRYSLSIAPFVDVAQGLIGKLTITPTKLSKSIFELRFLSRDRHLGQQILSTWMNEYLLYLRKTHDEMDREQIGYLEERQKQLYDHMSVSFDEYSNYLSENLKKHGFLGLEGEIEKTVRPLYEMSQKIFAIDVEMSRLNQMSKEEKVFTLGENTPLAKGLTGIFQEIQQLQQYRDSLALVFSSEEPLLAQNHLEDLRDLRLRQETLQVFQRQFEKKEPISSDLLFEPDQALALWATSLNLENEKERKDFVHYLENHSRLLSMREKILQERLIQPPSHVKELEGIDWETAKNLFLEYNQKLDESQALVRYYERLKEELFETHFELSSLSTVLQDPMSQSLLLEANRTLLLLKDEKHRSTKEGERWEEEIQLHKKILGEHLAQLLKIEEIKVELIQEKLRVIRQISFDAINQQLSILQKKALDLAREWRASLLSEKTLLQEKSAELREQTSQLPQSWRKGRWLDLKVQFCTHMMNTITEMVEAKTIGHHLYRIESKPLNIPILPLFAVMPRLYLKAFLAGAAGAFAFFFCSLLQTIFRGFPSSADKLKAMRFPLLGELSPFSDGSGSENLLGPDLELLRGAAFFLKKNPEKKVIGLLAGKGPDYSQALAGNLSYSSRRCLILRCDFQSKHQLEEGPGLLQFLEGKVWDLPVQEGKGFWYVKAGGFTPFGHEKLLSERFRALLEELKEKYDYLFLVSRALLSSAESLGLFEICDKAIVTVCGEPTELLTPFVSRSYDAVTFITAKAVSA